MVSKKETSDHGTFEIVMLVYHPRVFDKYENLSIDQKLPC